MAKETFAGLRVGLSQRDQKEKKLCNGHMCVTTIYFPIFSKTNIAISEKIFCKYLQVFCVCFFYFSLCYKNGQNKLYLSGTYCHKTGTGCVTPQQPTIYFI